MFYPFIIPSQSSRKVIKQYRFRIQSNPSAINATVHANLSPSLTTSTIALSQQEKRHLATSIYSLP